MKLAHCILTRYALRSAPVAHEAPNELPSADWLTHRRELFETYCLPSLVAQTNQEFVWLLLYHPALASITEALPAWRKRCPQIRGVTTTEPFENFNTAMRAAVRAHLAPGTTHVVTTRMDNDDMLAPDFVELIQAAVQGTPHRQFLNFSTGENWVLATDQRIPHPHLHNMFVSCVEPVDTFEGVLSWAHNSVGKVGELIQLPQPARWVHIIHDRNVWPLGRRA